MIRGISVFILAFFTLANSAFAGISFVKKTVIWVDEKEDVSLQQTFYSEGDKLRIEEDAKDIEGNPAVRIYDFEKKKMYTIMLDVKLYMEQKIPAEKEDIMFEIPPERRYSAFKEWEVIREKIGEDIIDGHPAAKYEIKVVRKKEKGKEKEEQVLERFYLWEAEDLENMPLKYEIELPNNKKKIIEYKEIKSNSIDPVLFSIPDGYMPITPF